MTQDKENIYGLNSTHPVTSSINKQSLLEDCQLEVLYDGSTPLTRFHKSLLLVMRLVSAFSRRVDRLKKYKTRILHHRRRVSGKHDTSTNSPENSALRNYSDPEFAVGELVKIRAIDEIRSLSDSLIIFEGMEKYCGKHFRIAKKVSTMYEPRLGKSIRLKNTYLLDGVHCDGRLMYGHEGCNRCCYFFWKGRWLEKVTNSGHCNQSVSSGFTSKSLFSHFRAGKKVRIRSFDEIKSQLNNQNRTDNLEFMLGMKKFCGHEFKIKAKMRFLINEESNEMRHLKNAYILDGVACDGQGITRPQKCERACLYVWHRNWLEGI